MKTKGFTVCLLAALLLCSSCSDKSASKESVPNVRLYSVKRVVGTNSDEFPGRVVAAEEVNMAFKVSGNLKEVYVNEGSKVSKGQLIAEIDPRDYQVQLDATEAEYHSIKAEAERVIALYSDSVATADEYDKARYGLKQITAKLENAKNQMSDTKIYAPFNGFVQKRLYDPPTVVAAGMPVITLVSNGKQEVEINIPSSTFMNRKNIIYAYAKFDYLPERQVPLVLTNVTPKANANQLYEARLELPSDLSPAPSPGMNTLVTLVTGTEESNKTEIPTTALFKKDGKSCVWLYDEKKQTISRKDVVVERLHSDGSAIISEGIDYGNVIVSVGVHKLYEGQKVRPLKEKSKTNIGGLL